MSPRPSLHAGSRAAIVIVGLATAACAQIFGLEPLSGTADAGPDAPLAASSPALILDRTLVDFGALVLGQPENVTTLQLENRGGASAPPRRRTSPGRAPRRSGSTSASPRATPRARRPSR